MRSRRDCPVAGCDRTMEPSHVMCRACWSTVPKELRDNVWRTYRAYGAWDDRAAAAREAALDHAEHTLTVEARA